MVVHASTHLKADPHAARSSARNACRPHPCRTWWAAAPPSSLRSMSPTTTPCDALSRRRSHRARACAASVHAHLPRSPENSLTYTPAPGARVFVSFPKETSMRIFRPVAALLALATLPAMAAAADDVAALRAELQAMKSDYSTRVDALEARIQQLETVERRAADAAMMAATAAPPEPAPSRAGRQRCVGIQSGDVADSRRHVHQHLARSRRLAHRGLRARGRRDRSRRAQLQSRRIRADLQRQHRSVLRRCAHGRDHRRQRDRGRGGVLSHHRVATMD